MKPDIELLQRWFAYDPEQGVLIRKLKLSSRLSDIVGCEDKRVYFFGRRYPYTHVIWAVHYGKWPDEFIDHIDHNQFNNKLENLREANANQNQHNKLSWSKYGKGVSYNKCGNRAKPYIARISVNGESIFLGSYAKPEEAAQAYRDAVVEYHKDFACVD